MTLPDFVKCRVLELGYASGGNFIPIAEVYPKSWFISVGFSKVQIDIGSKDVFLNSSNSVKQATFFGFFATVCFFLLT
jgi:hypothetical protein